MLKKTIFAAALVLTAGFIQAQELSMKNTLKIGVLGGASVPSNNAAANVGVDIAYQNLITPHFGLGIATGYNHFFGKENTVNNTKLKNNSFGVVPVAGLVRYYPKSEGIYVGTDLGYGVIVGDKKVVDATTPNADMPGGGFYLKPEIGYHNRHWNIFGYYAKVFTGDKGTVPVGTTSQKFNAGSIGVGVAYNIGLGRGR